MLNMKPYTPSSRLAVRDSIDEELSDDVEDEVFIRDGKSIRMCEEKGLKRPLMAPRRRSSYRPIIQTTKARKTVSSFLRKRARCRGCCETFCYMLSALLVLIAIVCLTIFLMALFPVALQKVKMFIHDNNMFGSSLNITDLSNDELFIGEQTPCTQMAVNKVWSKAFSRLNTETPIRKVDLNGDKILDIVFGYGVDDSIQHDTDESGQIPKCELASNGERREIAYCKGGIVALDGANGSTIWQHWTTSIVFSLYCNTDLNKDGYPDCVASGDGRLALAINGRNGEMIWRLKESTTVTPPSLTPYDDFYTVNGVRDLDEDSVADVLVAHVKEYRTNRPNSTTGYITILSGQSGNIIRTIPAPYNEKLYVPPQIYTQMDGTEYILVVTGAQSSPGGVYLIPLGSIMDHSKENEFITVYRNKTTGFMVPAILADLNSDGIDDIIVSSFNSTLYAFNGRTYAILWSYTFANSESISSIVPGHYNSDNVTDFMVKYSYGPGYPIYYYSQTQIINGKNGSALLDRMIHDAGGANSLLGGVSISQTFGGDLFLHWQTHCRGQLDVNEPYQFIPDSDTYLQARADACMLRYNSSTILKLYAITRHIQPPGAIIFSTDDLLLQLNQTELKRLENQIAVSPLKHPKLSKQTVSDINELKSNTANRVFATQPNQEDKPNIAKDLPNAFEAPESSRFAQKIKHRPKIFDSLQQSNDINEQQEIQQQLQQQHQQQRLRLDSISNGEKFLMNEQTNQQDIQLPIDRLYDAESEVPTQRKNRFKSYGQQLKTFENVLEQPIDDEQPRLMDMGDYFIDESGNNRNTRSGGIPKDFFGATYNDSFSSHTRPNDMSDSSENISKTKKKDRAETLWDLEMENENEERIQRDDHDSSADSEASGQVEDVNRKRRQLPELSMLSNQNLLAQISSTGVLLQSLDKTPSTLDFVFVLNVRESELYPPLVLRSDFKCLEEKLSTYQSEFNSEYAKANFELAKNQILKRCVLERLPNLAPHSNQMDAQIVVTRISIKCACGDLKTGEQCSTFNRYEDQKWTEFMGNMNSGAYRSY